MANADPKKSVSSKIYFFADELIDITDISKRLLDMFGLKSKVYINDSNDDMNVCFTIYIFNKFDKARIDDVFSVLKDIIKMKTDKEMNIFYKDMCKKGSNSYDIKYHVKGKKVKNKIHFINDNDNDDNLGY